MNIYNRSIYKQSFHILQIVLLFVNIVLLSSCLNDSDANKENITNSVVLVHNSSIGTTFTLPTGREVIPTVTSLETMRTTNQFNDHDAKVAYIAFQYENDQITEDKILDVEMLYATSLDRTVERVDYVDAPNDSASVAPIITLDVIGTDTAEDATYARMLGKYLLISNRYFLANTSHYFTLVYKSDEITANSDKLQVYLRHNNNGDTALLNTSYQYRAMYPAVYWMAFDLSEALEEFTLVTGRNEVPIQIVTYNNGVDLNMKNAEKTLYKCTHK